MSWWMLALFACGDPSPDTEAEVSAPEDTGVEVVYTPVTDLQLARRITIDLRGTLPTAGEYALVQEQGEAGLETLLASVLADERLESRMVVLFNELWHTRVDALEVPPEDYGFTMQGEYAFYRAVGEEPLRILAHVVAEDLPWSDVVEAEYTMANDTLIDMWGLTPLDETATGWRPATYADDRPHVGVLSTNGMWWRYTTTTSNMNRARASNAIRLLLCDDYLARPITFSRSASEAEAEGKNSALTEASCRGCHASLDPLAAAFFGFYTTVDYNLFELESYHPEREQLGMYMMDVTPAYFGQPIEGLSDVGRLMAQDPRLTRCAAESAARMLWRREVELGDFATVTALEDELVANALSFQTLLAAVTRTEVYRAGSVDGVELSKAESLPTRRLLTANHLHTILSDLGLEWKDVSTAPILDNSNRMGLMVYGGGVDGLTNSAPQTQPGLTWALVVKRAAEAVSAQVVTSELQQDGDRALFPASLTLEDLPGDAAFEEALASVHLRILASELDEETREGLVDLWDAVYTVESDTGAAWRAVLTVLFRDPDFTSY